MPKATHLIPEDMKEIYEHWKAGGSVDEFYKALEAHYEKQARRDRRPMEETVIRGKGKERTVDENETDKRDA